MPLIDVPPGHVGAVVTYLETRERPKPRPAPDAQGLLMVRWREVAPAKYRLLFERVGANWLWYSRLTMDDATLLANVADVHAVIDRRRIEVGMLELDFREPRQCLIRFLGLVPELAGRGHGKWLFAQTLALAWRPGVERVHVNTCSLDHPAALPSPGSCRARRRLRSRSPSRPPAGRRCGR
jgi:GNAT superfamily N-acetyltransferase